MKGNKVSKVILALVLCPLAMYLFSLTLPKRYTARMSLLVTPEARASMANQPDAQIVSMINRTATRSIPTTLDLIYSSDVLLEAVRRTAEKYPRAFQDGEQAGARYASLVNRLRVDNNKESEVVNLSVTMDDPQIAAETANNIGYALNDQMDRRSREVGLMVAKQIDDYVNERQVKLNEVDTKIANLMTDAGVGDPNSRMPIDEKSVAEMKVQIAQVDAQYQGAAGELSAAQQILRTTPKYVRTNVTTARAPSLDVIESEITRAESDLAGFRGTFTDNHPTVRRLVEKLNGLKARRASMDTSVTQQENTSLNPNYTAAENAVASASAKVASLGNSLAALQGRIGELQGRLTIYPKLTKDMDALRREKISLENDYQFWKQKRSSLAVTDDIARGAPVQIVSTAFAPGSASFPNTRLFVLMGLAVGIVISALIIMPKAPEVVYAPLPGDTLALDPAGRTSADSLPQGDPNVGRPAIEPTGSA